MTTTHHTTQATQATLTRAAALGASASVLALLGLASAVHRAPWRLTATESPAYPYDLAVGPEFWAVRLPSGVVPTDTDQGF